MPSELNWVYVIRANYWTALTDWQEELPAFRAYVNLYNAWEFLDQYINRWFFSHPIAHRDPHVYISDDGISIDFYDEKATPTESYVYIITKLYLK